MADASNRVEAEKCKQIARNALAAGDTAKALRFLEKAKVMCPSDASIDGLVVQAQSGGRPKPSGGDSRGEPAPAGVQQRTAASASGERPPSGGGATTSGKNGSYTADQMQLAQRILRTKDYYEILEVDRGANEDTIKKAYKKMALKLHPDKNKAPGAEEAFKKLSKVAQCLSDSGKREAYNRYGDEDRIPRHSAQQQDFMDEFEFFQNFFNFPHQPQRNVGQPQQHPLLQFAPVALILLFTMFSSNFWQQDSSFNLYSWTYSAQHHIERSTASLNVAYFVTERFQDSYAEGTRALAEFDEMIEIDYIRILVRQCDSQRLAYDKAKFAARRSGTSEDELAQNHPRPACDQKNKIKRKHAALYNEAVLR